ncbi:hypothetical protein GWA01_03630 [Gluconobacter wancherniae NBRC 103581]|uniref:Uncharacterized protein n=1 Tax=Gluconobacter wancherniae NBRC 103581 TaxID=656744 RepID=A0A511AZ63_9PROT|nr:hypothetical protein AA103581_1092 [Gluconobacter wancherniae NBRC 103581]GEK92593.1 hypothetical protein GWA01_03630 [Gluconobacter wancherniae NBRC 103581]
MCSGENTEKWGDLATWAGSGVSCLALIAAITATIWSKNASDVANENSTFLSLNSLVELESQKFSLEYEKMKNNVIDFKQKIRCIHAGSISIEETHRFSLEAWGEINRNSLKMNHIFIKAKDNILYAKISSSSREKLMKNFLESIDYEFIFEALFQNLTKDVIECCKENFFGSEMFYENYKSIVLEMNNFGMYSLLFDQAKKNGNIDYLKSV